MARRSRAVIRSSPCRLESRLRTSVTWIAFFALPDFPKGSGNGGRRCRGGFVRSARIQARNPPAYHPGGGLYLDEPLLYSRRHSGSSPEATRRYIPLPPRTATAVARRRPLPRRPIRPPVVISRTCPGTQ